MFSGGQNLSSKIESHIFANKSWLFSPYCIVHIYEELYQIVILCWFEQNLFWTNLTYCKIFENFMGNYLTCTCFWTRKGTAKVLATHYLPKSAPDSICSPTIPDAVWQILLRHYTGCPKMFYTVFQKNIKDIKSTMRHLILVIECLICALPTVKISFTYLYPLRCDMVSLKIDE